MPHSFKNSIWKLLLRIDYFISILEWTEEEYFVRNKQVRERSFEACNALKLAFQLNENPQKIKNFIGKTFLMRAAVV